MTKGILIKAGIILGIFGVTLGLAFGCSSVTDRNVTPQLTNGEDVYLTVGDITITNQDLWDMMKLSDGVNYLNQYLEEYLLSEYVDNLTQTEIDDAIEAAIYGTNDPDRIAEIQEDPDREADLIEAFEQSLVIMGFDPLDDEDLRAYAELNVAKEKYTREFILDAEEGDSLFIDEEAIQNYYEDTTKGDVCVLPIRFYSSAEANALFEENNLVPNYNQGFGKYFGTLPIDEVLTGNFDETNTTQMTDEEVFEEFLILYNIMNPSDTPIATDITFEDFCADHADEFTYNYTEMTENRSANDPYVDFADYIFDTLSLEEDDVRYSYRLQSIDVFDLLVFKVAQDDVTAFEDLDQATIDALKDEMVEDSITTNAINIAMDALWDQYELEVYDPMFKLQYAFNGDEEFDNKGDDRLVATFGDLEITADLLFDYMQNILGTYYTIEIVKAESLLQSEYYTDIYGESHDYLNSNNEKMVEHRDELREMKSIFSSDGYAAYGFSSANYTWEEFLVLAFGSYTEADVIRDLFVIGSLQPYLVRDMIAYQQAETFIQTKVDEYFSLNATHLLAYVDFDFDFSGDEYNDYVDGLSGADLTTYNALVVDLENLIIDKVENDEMSFEEIVEEYNESLINDDTNEWQEFKEFGFFLLTQNLATNGSLTPATTENYDEDFVTALKRIYDDYVILVDNSLEDVDEYLDDRLVQTDFGLHLIRATEGDGFEQPTAVYEDEDGDYSEGSDGTTVAPNESQVELYIEIRFAERIGETTDVILPTSVYDALEAYYKPVFDAYFTTSGFSIATAELILGNNPQYATDQADRIAFLNNVLDILYDVNFPEGFDADAE